MNNIKDKRFMVEIYHKSLLVPYMKNVEDAIEMEAKQGFTYCKHKLSDIQVKTLVLRGFTVELVDYDIYIISWN